MSGELQADQEMKISIDTDKVSSQLERNGLQCRGGTSLSSGSKARAELWLTVNKPQARGSMTLIFRKAQISAFLSVKSLGSKQA